MQEYLILQNVCGRHVVEPGDRNKRRAEAVLVVPLAPFLGADLGWVPVTVSSCFHLILYFLGCMYRYRYVDLFEY